VARMGPQARVWRALARAEAKHAFEPIEGGVLALEEFCEFDDAWWWSRSFPALFVGARISIAWRREPRGVR